MCKISVIIPIYNTGKILSQTLKSIQNQTFKDFECLLINDGSTDTLTLEIINNFVKKDKRFINFSKPNEGIEKTRIYGVHKASADLLVFCDHDDFYENKAFEVLFKAYLISYADIICANCYSQRFYNNRIGRKLITPSLLVEKIVDIKDFYNNFFMNFFGINKFPVSTWGKLYKKDLFKHDIQHFGVNFIEDIIINIQVFNKAKKIHFIPDIIYTHIYGGLSASFNFHDVINGYDKIYLFRKAYLDKLNLDCNSLYIEFKNVITQNINLLIDHRFSKNEFINEIEYLKNTILFKEMSHNLLNNNKSEYIKLIENDELENLYLLANSKLDTRRRIIHSLKKIIKKF